MTNAVGSDNYTSVLSIGTLIKSDNTVRSVLSYYLCGRENIIIRGRIKLLFENMSVIMKYTLSRDWYEIGTHKSLKVVAVTLFKRRE